MIYQTAAEFLHNLLPNQRLLGLDYGSKRIGVAISDSLRVVATPHSTIIRKSNAYDLNLILKLISEFGICGIVIGWPIRMNGEMGDACKLVSDFTNKLLNMSDLACYYQDERLSTAAVNRMLEEYSFTRKKKETIDDKLAASYILQSGLDKLNHLIRAL